MGSKPAMLLSYASLEVFVLLGIIFLGSKMSLALSCSVTSLIP